MFYTILLVVILAMFFFSTLALCQLALDDPEASRDVLKAVGDFFIKLLRELRKFVQVAQQDKSGP